MYREPEYARKLLLRFCSSGIFAMYQNEKFLFCAKGEYETGRPKVSLKTALIKLQDGEEVSHLAHNQETVGANPTPASST